jgi:PAB-dependent poly(A)-specific ribonuclease subunit 2
VFVGHGLKKDFRIINILVPENQGIESFLMLVIDTVDIYHLPSKHRKLSLRFLSWWVLGLEIQTDMHDSIEDAKTAFLLYLYYERKKGEGVWEAVLDDIYEGGKGVGYRVPGGVNSPAVNRKK